MYQNEEGKGELHKKIKDGKESSLRRRRKKEVRAHGYEDLGRRAAECDVVVLWRPHKNETQRKS